MVTHTQGPTVAAVIPARNAAEYLADCVRCIRAQSRAVNEIWIVVGPSTDGTAEVAGGLANEATAVVDNPPGDRGSAINRALDLTRAEVVVLVDAQARLHPDYVERAIVAMERSGAAVVGGPMRPEGRTAVGRAMAIALRSTFGVGNSQFHFAGEARDVESVYLGVYRASVLEQVGRYHAGLLRTEDDDLNARIRAAGCRIRLDPAIHSTYLCRNRLADIWAQYHGYGYWKVALATIRPEAVRARHVIPAVFTFVVTAATLVTASVWRPALPVLATAYAVVAWLAAVVAGARGLPVLAVFPVVTLSMHLGYGVGTISGLMRWRKLRRIAQPTHDEARRSVHRS